MALHIITDSGSDILEGELQGVHVVPLSIAFGETSYQDGVDLSRERFYELLIESDGVPTTSQVTPFAFSQLLDQCMQPQDEAIIICLSSKLSGTYESACIAAKSFGERVSVFDSLNVCLGERILVEYAAELVKRGQNRAQIIAKLEEKRSKVVLIALLDTLEYLRKGGRISHLAGALGTVLSLKPVVAVVDGEVAVLGKARGSKNGRNLLNEQIEVSGGADWDLPLAVGYSGLSSSLLDKYVEDNKDVWQPHIKKVPQFLVGATIGTHAGPNAIAVAFFSRGNKV